MQTKSSPPHRGLTPPTLVIMTFPAWFLVFCLKLANGVSAALVASLLGAAAVFVFVLGRVHAPAAASTRARWLPGLAILLAALNLGYAAVHLRHPPGNDIATATLAAGRMLLHGENPYDGTFDLAAMADVADIGGLDPLRFGGFKYGPVMAALYIPLGFPFGIRGLVLTNALLVAGTTLLLFRLAETMADRAAGYRAMCLFASLPLVLFQLYAKGVTDLAPMVMLLGGWYARGRSPFVSGLCVGLALSTKTLPALIVAPLLLPRTRSVAYLLGVVVGALPLFAMFLWNPDAAVDNLIRFNELRPIDSTSWLYGRSAATVVAAHVLFLVTWIATAAVFLRHPPSPAARLRGACILTIMLLLCGPAVHENYEIWWIPLFVIVVAAPGRRGPAAVQSRAVETA